MRFIIQAKQAKLTGKAEPPENADVPVFAPPNENPVEAVEAGGPPNENPVEALEAGAPPKENPDAVVAAGAPNEKPVAAVVFAWVPKPPVNIYRYCHTFT